MPGKIKVSYYHDPDFGNYYYGEGHYMKPQRVCMTTNLVARYDLVKHMNVFRPLPASADDIARFHRDDYVAFLKHVSHGSTNVLQKQLSMFGLVGDCPPFQGLWQCSQSAAGASIGGAVQLNHKKADIVINWSGGLHHAKKSAAAGFCYVNDIVLGILELLKYHQRVLYLDIDVHHGDGVEEAFSNTNRVLTVSFHKFGKDEFGKDFFPKTGRLDSVGQGVGKYYAVNVPLEDGMDDSTFDCLFRPIMAKVMEVYRPEAIVLQSGADSLAGDKIGRFNLSSRGHGACHAFMKAFGVPMLVLGGGGYTVRNVARCWAYETGVLLGQDMENELPPNEYREAYGPDYRLHVEPSPGIRNDNTTKTLQRVLTAVMTNLGNIHPVGVGFHERPPDGITLEGVNSTSCTNDALTSSPRHASCSDVVGPISCSDGPRTSSSGGFRRTSSSSGLSSGSSSVSDWLNDERRGPRLH